MEFILTPSHVGHTTVDNAKIKTLALRLRKDFGRNFLVTLAPCGTELLVQGGSTTPTTLSLRRTSTSRWTVIMSRTTTDPGRWRWRTLGSGFERGVPRLSTLANNDNGDPSLRTNGNQVEKGLSGILARYPDVGGRRCWERHSGGI